MPLTKFIQHGNDELLTTTYIFIITVNTYLFKYVPVKSGFIILSLIGVLRIPEECYLYKDKDKDCYIIWCHKTLITHFICDTGYINC